jgi:hypothetical protein
MNTIQMTEDANDKLEIGIFGFRGWLWDQHFSVDHHICFSLAEHFSH